MKPYEKTCPVAYLLNRSKDLKEAGKFNQSSICSSAAKSFERYASSRKIKCLSFIDITTEFLKGYEVWMLTQGKLNKSDKEGSKGKPASLTSVGMYCESLRYVYRQAIESGVVKQKDYPFGIGKYTIATVSNTRTPRTKDEIQMIMDYLPTSEKEHFFRDMFVFSYLSCGINCKDLINLKKTDIDVESMSFRFIREKSKTTNRTKKKVIEGVLFDQSLKIIQTWIEKDSEYLFPVLKSSMSAYEKESTKKYFILQLNRHMKTIAEKLGIKGKVRSNEARHSFANVLMQSETPLAMISAALGHSKIQTTENYLGRFSDVKKREYLSRLL